jgi:outer membrane lipoprotein carrier protein
VENVNISVIRIVLGLCLCLPAFGADAELTRVLRGVEERYNHAKTLQVGFDESYSIQGRSGRPESGTLSLRKPGKMRWDYRTPAGKLFVSDGKDVFYYTPVNNRVEKMKLKESEDMRAPLAFLLGKLEFERDFENFRAKRGDGGNMIINAKPKSDRLPYKEVEFSVTPEFEIHKLDVVGHDDSVLTFVFTNERLNPSLEDRMFKFQMPKNAIMVDSTQQQPEGR